MQYILSHTDSSIFILKTAIRIQKDHVNAIKKLTEAIQNMIESNLETFQTISIGIDCQWVQGLDCSEYLKPWLVITKD